MTSVRQAVRPHPVTVSRLSRGEVRRRREQRRRTAPVAVEQLTDPDTLALAKHLAGGDVSRLRFNGDGSVTVTN